MRRSRSEALLTVIQKIFFSSHLKTYLQLLALPTIHLRELIEQELSTNPLLEIEEGPSLTLNNGIELSEWLKLRLEGPESEEEEAVSEEESEEEEELNKILEELSLNEIFEDYSESEEEVDPFENFKKNENLRDYLLEECQRINLNEDDRKMAEIIIDNIDERGFLITPLEEIAKKKGVEIERLNKIRWKIMRELHPDGIGSFNFEEFLAFQLEQKFPYDNSLHNFIKKCSEILLSGNALKKIKEVGISVEEIKENLKKLRMLRPFPFHCFHLEDVEYPNADIIISKSEKGYTLVLNNEGIPRLRINRCYLHLLKKQDTDPETKRFLKNKKKSAELLIKSLDARNKTIYKVAEAIIECQKEFLEKGVDFIKPMKMKDLAEKLNLDESTVSRAISNKSISTEFGVFPLRFFFHSGIDSERGEKISSVYLKNRIKELIENEDKDNPFSDSEIVEILRREGVKIARRTVAKYREEIGILSAPMRKRINVLGVKS